MIGYSWKADGEPVKKHDHCPDALRCAVATYLLEGWVHVYRELVIEDPVGKNMSNQNLCAAVRQASGHRGG